MPRSLFIAGTDTGVGKTAVSAALLRRAVRLGLRACGMKPVAAGTTLCDGRVRQEDVEALIAAGNVAAPREVVCPWLLSEAASPHIAAAREGLTLDIGRIEACFAQLSRSADCLIVEGAGGWYAPLDTERSMADVARRLRLPVVLVVGLRLGCLNHAMLTAHAIRTDGLALAGWVANEIDSDMMHKEANVSYLTAKIAAPLLGHIPRLPAAAAHRTADDYLGGADALLRP